MADRNSNCGPFDFGCEVEKRLDQARYDAEQMANNVNRELSNAGNSVNSAVNQATGGASLEDVAINIATGGLIGYDIQTGGIKAGAITRANVEGIGELTGANQARRANNIAEQALRDQKAEAERLRQEELDRMKRNDIAASRKAGQQQANSYLTASSAAGTQAYNNLTRDFLGL